MAAELRLSSVRRGGQQGQREWTLGEKLKFLEQTDHSGEWQERRLRRGSSQARDRDRDLELYPVKGDRVSTLPVC